MAADGVRSALRTYVPPPLYYRLDRAAGQLEPVLRFKRGWGRRSREPCTHGRLPPGNSPPNLG